MFIWVCSLTRAAEMVSFHKPERIISLLSADHRFPVFEGYDDETHLKIAMDDVGGAVDAGPDSPAAKHAQSIIDFARGWPQTGPLLIHCLVGISRSSAAAFIAACALNPRTDPDDIAADIRRNSQTARPNPHLVAHADKVLQRRGRMVAALQVMKDSRGFDPGQDIMPYRIDASPPDKGGHV